MDLPRRTSQRMTTAEDDAARFAELFPAVYLRAHARQDKADRVTPEMWAILTHLAMSGPLTVTEAARHFGRAQSVISETVTALEQRGLLERASDARDRRRTLVWLTERAHETMKRSRSVLDEARLARAMARMSEDERRALVTSMEALVAACDAEARTDTAGDGGDER